MPGSIRLPRAEAPVEGPQQGDYRAVNGGGWDRLAQAGCDSSIPYGPDQFVRADKYLDERGWLPWDGFESVLCLAAGGGQQGPLFASLGYDVTVFDLSEEQLRRDRLVAELFGLHITCVQGDMLDLSALPRRSFDLVYQPVSTLYVPDVRRLYAEVARVLRPGGLYYAEHWNPVQMQVSETHPWDGGAYRVEYRAARGVARPWTTSGRTGTAVCQHFIHSLDDLIGGLCSAGFTISRFGERDGADGQAAPGEIAHLSAFIPTFYAILARRRRDAGAPTTAVRVG